MKASLYPVKNLVPADIQDTIDRSWDTLGTVVAIPSLARLRAHIKA